MKKMLCNIFKKNCGDASVKATPKENKLTVAVLKEAFPLALNTKLQYYHLAILETCEKYKINTPERIAAFLSQCAHESANFSLVGENLNYSSDALRRVFPKYFPTAEIALKYNRKPEQIANRVYANRMGNGNVSSGDGWKYRGRGFIQITGKYNYIECDKDLKLGLLNKPEQLQESPAAVLSAGWFWDKNNLNVLADKEDILSLTKRINGGTNGLADRKKKYDHAIKILKKYLD